MKIRWIITLCLLPLLVSALSAATMTVYVHADGQMDVSYQGLNESDVRDLLSGEFAGDAKISAESTTQFKFIIKAAELCQEAGIQNCHFEVIQPKLPVKPEINAPAEELTINVTKDGSCVINGTSFTQEELGPKLVDLVSKSELGKAQPVRIRGDKDTKFQEVVKVIDVCQKAEIWNISFAVKKPKSE